MGLCILCGSSRACLVQYIHAHETGITCGHIYNNIRLDQSQMYVPKCFSLPLWLMPLYEFFYDFSYFLLFPLRIPIPLDILLATIYIYGISMLSSHEIIYQKT